MFRLLVVFCCSTVASPATSNWDVTCTWRAWEGGAGVCVPQDTTKRHGIIMVCAGGPPWMLTLVLGMPVLPIVRMLNPSSGPRTDTRVARCTPHAGIYIYIWHMPHNCAPPSLPPDPCHPIQLPPCQPMHCQPLQPPPAAGGRSLVVCSWAGRAPIQHRT